MYDEMNLDPAKQAVKHLLQVEGGYRHLRDAMVYLAGDYIFGKFSYVGRYSRQSLPILVLTTVRSV